MSSLCFSNGSRYLLSAGEDHKILVWDLKHSSIYRTFESDGKVYSAVFSLVKLDAVASGGET